ncbi:MULTISPECIES: flagellar basal body-associated FliL family protein [Erythrobacter]|uniref:Flagellar protein FliL n=1 Tax=Erythrobacter aureus TaxID=2182384 RepID=A0A345YH36_9SPHN|nr:MULTISPECIES: flagellar basal body-associated FliL family protein [Erythrobacter]MAS04805.1 flagellar basal body-associated protein FliL [Ahrensia sp.]MBL43524.1 flagellar basal body-associated protein FliL [Sphingomonadaceae bacterium]MBQ95440.1 flagellar basal body-associated protein FliL [Actinomycetota bacterium]AXK43238.1 flagellar basal body-associated protein FliL [Erythrobacter aureus]MCF8883823.1 flagellar basal body-associated FliL family protein [Erythrobacter sp. SN021]
MSTENVPPETPPKKKGGKLKPVLFSVLLLAAGGGGTYAAFASGMLGAHGAQEEDNNPKLVRKGDEDPYPFAGGGEAKDKAPVVHGAGGGEYRTAYYNFTEEFTSNLANGNALVQVSIAASTHYDGRVLMWLAEHETALRSRILAELAATSEEDLASIKGKEELQQRLTKALNEVLEEREGFGGVDSVYFRSFIVQ